MPYFGLLARIGLLKSTKKVLKLKKIDKNGIMKTVI